uniref:Uncharacterized protein n=1 Tax=Anguilla anguilla TaxID=7936 RepID=A0A0E9UE28_ANGAN
MPPAGKQREAQCVRARILCVWGLRMSDQEQPGREDFSVNSVNVTTSAVIITMA